MNKIGYHSLVKRVLGNISSSS
uniref:Uncharacterized protein n=1 Tax=Rhizophora mucronata TaxID=61149 RepID=A0A2P2N4Z4_RHIMU